MKTIKQKKKKKSTANDASDESSQAIEYFKIRLNEKLTVAKIIKFLMQLTRMMDIVHASSRQKRQNAIAKTSLRIRRQVNRASARYMSSIRSDSLFKN